MKTKILCLLLSILFVLALTACGDTPADTTPFGTEKAGEFVVTGEKYAYKNKDVLLLNVENLTDKNYDVTAVVHYFDAEGNELKSQKKTFAGWAAGYQNYFFFQPNITFDNFTYHLELEELSGEECYTKQIKAMFVELTGGIGKVEELIKKGDFSKHPIIDARFQVENGSDDTLYIAGTRVVFDNTGNIYFVNSVKQIQIVPQCNDDQYITVYYDLVAEDLVWPEELTGDVRGVYVITRIWQ